MSDLVNQRKHIVDTAGYWYRGAYADDTPRDERLLCMANAYNHAENALLAALEVIVELQGGKPAISKNYVMSLIDQMEKKKG